MPYQIVITPGAEQQLAALPARERRILRDAISSRLADRPKALSRAIKRLRPNPLAKYELRVGDLRILYDVDDEVVSLLIFGRKRGNALIVDGEEFHGHQGDPSEPP